MEKDERAALAARLKAFLLATEKKYLDGIADNLIHEAEVKTAILSDNEAREPEFVFISYLLPLHLETSLNELVNGC